MAEGGSNRKVANSLVAASAAAVLSVYAAGYSRTKSAADQFEAQSRGRRAAAPQGRGPAPSTTESPSAIPRNDGDALPDTRTSTAPTSPNRDDANAPVRVASLDHPASGPIVPAASHAPELPSQAPQQKPEIPAAVPVVSPVVVATPPAPVTIAEAIPPSPPVAPALPVPPPAAKWKDGTFTGWGTCRHGDIQAQVVIESGRITSATIAQCLTRYSCNVIGMLPKEVIQRQSGETDYVSGATESANAFYYAVADALGKAK